METHDYIQESTIKLLETRLQDCDLSVHTLNCLRVAELETVCDLCRCQKTDLLKLRNFGKRSLKEVEEFLEENGLSWKFIIRK